MGTVSAETQEMLELVRFLEGGVAARAVPAAQASVVQDGREVHASANGVDPHGRPVTTGSLFDVASVTKAVATTGIAATLIAHGELSLQTRIASVLPAFAGAGKDTVTVRELLAHASGLPAWEPLFAAVVRDPEGCAIYPPSRPAADAGAGDYRHAGAGTRESAFIRARRIVVDQVLAAPLTVARGSRLYSDLGFIALGELLEAAGGERLHRLARERVFAPLGLSRARFFDLAAGDVSEGHVVATGSTRPREPAPGQEHLYRVHDQPPRPDPGEVDDDNAYAMGGIAGHAGLFGTAQDVARFGWQMLEELDGAGRLGPRAAETLSLLVRADRDTRGSPRGLGFDIPSPEGSMAGDLLGRGGPLGGFGHNGFTGCSLWVDRDRRLSVALLTNRVYPTRRNVEPARAFRRGFHDLVIRSLPGPP